MSVQIDVINASTVVPDHDVSKYVGALQRQVTEHWAPIWGSGADLHFVPKSQHPDDRNWWLVFLDTSDVADALGYHDLTSAGLPIGKVFAKSDLEIGSAVSVTASHELLEMLGDPDINLNAWVDHEQGGSFYAYEVCDPVEADGLGYVIDGVLVCDFVFPSYFEFFRGPGLYDFGKHVRRPFEILPGGYQSVYRPGHGWTQIVAQGQRLGYHQIPKRGSRSERRRRARTSWIPSRAIGT